MVKELPVFTAGEIGDRRNLSAACRSFRLGWWDHLANEMVSAGTLIPIVAKPKYGSRNEVRPLFQVRGKFKRPHVKELALAVHDVREILLDDRNL